MKAAIRKLAAALFVAGLAVTAAGRAARAECGGKILCPGTIITRENIDSLKDATFEGHKIGDILVDRIALEIREYGLKIKLAPRVAYRLDPRYVAATEKYSRAVKFDPATDDISGWVAGVPFPKVDADDPKAGWKVIWNVVRGRTRGDTVELPRVFFLLIGGNTGLERVQEWAYLRYGMAGNIRAGAAPTVGDGSAFEKTMLFAKSPQDIKGIGTFTTRYATGRVDDSWAYVREVRRTRRLSGGAWMEPVGSLDFNSDDIAGYNAHPLWYKNFEVIGRKTILAIAHHEWPLFNEQATDPAGRYPRIDLANAPHWNPVDQWEPRDVYIVKATPPAEHSDGHKLLFVGADAWDVYLNLAYDKKGDFLRTHLFEGQEYPIENEPSAFAHWEGYSSAIDFQKRHASIYYSSGDVRFNGGVSEDAVSLPALEALGR